MTFKFFKATRKNHSIGNILAELEDRGHRVYTHARDTDISIILHGTFENPCIFKGKKVLAFNSEDWGKHGEWEHLFKPILEEYYDEFIDITGLSSKEQAGRLIEYGEAQSNITSISKLRGGQKTDPIYEPPEAA